MSGRHPAKPLVKVQRAGILQATDTSKPMDRATQRPAFRIADEKQVTGMLSQGPTNPTEAFVSDRERVNDAREEPRQDYDPSTPRPIAMKNQVEPTQESSTLIPAVRCLCSESFLESQAAIVAELSSGTWGSSPTESSTNRMVSLVDTPLLDRCKVDIETPDQRGVVILMASQQLSTSETAKDTILFLVELAAMRRYDRITVFILLDDPTSEMLPVYIAKIHCAMSGQHEKRGLSKMAVIPMPPNMISSAIAKLARLAGKTSPEQNDLDFHATELVATANPLAIERAFFLLDLVPSLSAYGALQCLLLADQLAAGNNGGDNDDAGGFAALFTNKMLRQQIILKIASKQLGMGINPSAMTHLSRLLQAQL
jgi:hypothetical protein